MGPNRDGLVSGDGLATEWKDGKLPVLWQTGVGFGTAPVVVAKGRVYTFGLFKPGTKPEDIPLAASTPTLEEVRAGSTMDGQPLSTRQLPDSPSWAEDHHPAYRADEYAFCLDAATGKLLWSTHAFQPSTVDPIKWPGEWSAAHSILAGDRLIVFNRWGLWIARLTETGVTVLAQGPGFEVEGSEPVLVDGRLYVRQIALRHSAQDEGRGPYARGNLVCYDVRAGAEGN